ncbi:hypothetical protein ACFQ08_25570, partial [Streptosporangium algeriense]
MTLHHTPDPLPEDDDSMGELVRFPLRDNGAAAPLEGTVVPRTTLPDTPDGPAPLVRLLGQAVEHVVRLRDDERTVRLTRGALGVTVTIGQGWHSWLVRAWDALTLGAYRRQIRAAEAMGDRTALAEWMDRKQ